MSGRRVRNSLSFVALLLAAGAFASGAFGQQSVTCKPSGTLRGSTVVFCGPATGHLSVFRTVTFKQGTCGHTGRGSHALMTLKLGVRTQDANHNGGRSYFGLSISGPISHPTGGGIVGFYKGKRWGGAGVSFNGTARSGTFVAKGINGSRGNATGSYRCS